MMVSPSIGFIPKLLKRTTKQTNSERYTQRNRERGTIMRLFVSYFSSAGAGFFYSGGNVVAKLAAVRKQYLNE